MTDALRAKIDEIETAVERRAVLAVGYNDAAGAVTKRRLRPLGLLFWGKVWTLVVWCELREDFRSFRLDRIVRLDATGETFRAERDKSLRTFFRTVEAERRCQAATGADER
jgi:predicted DNA-binding transcriptional regulator YafY